MKQVSTRKPYGGPTRSLVIAVDIGTTFSGVSYAILEPGEIPKIHGVTRFPGQEHVAGNSKIPSVIYYDKEGRMMAAGAEADTSAMMSRAEDEEWVKAELFKLRLRPRTMKLDMNGMRLSRLPQGKTPVEVFGDFLSYLYLCTRNFIRDTHANGKALWNEVERSMQFVLSHPNGWEGAQQTAMRRSAIHGGLIPDTNEGKARIRFVTEGEASLHACVLNGLASDVLTQQRDSHTGFLVADAGGGTLDISSYRLVGVDPIEIEEIAAPDCVFAGSVFVSRRARQFLKEKLRHSKYGTSDAVDHIAKRFDETTKRLFRDKRESQFIPFGSPLDKDPSVGIRSGQLKLTGDEVADLFEPSVQAAVEAIKKQIEGSSGAIKSIFLVGGYAASAWLFSQLQERLAPFNVSVSRPDAHTSKAVADGAIGFYCDHHVSTRMSKFMYGVEFLREFDAKKASHVARQDRLCELPSGPKLLQDAFDCILARGIKVKESQMFSRKYSTEVTNINSLSMFEVEIWCYRGSGPIPEWINRHADNFSTLCLVRADLSLLSGSAQAKQGKSGKPYWTIIFSVEIHFGLTEFTARIKWVDKAQGTTKYGPASIIYNERGHRVEDDDLGSHPEDDNSAYPPSSRQSPASTSRPLSRSQTRTRSSRPSVAPTMPTSPLSPNLSSSLIDDLEKERGRSMGKAESSDPNPPGFDTLGLLTRSSSMLGDALASVWGASSSPLNPALSGAPIQEQTTPMSPPAPVRDSILGSSNPSMPGSLTPKAAPQEVTRSRPSSNRSSVHAHDAQSVSSRSKSSKLHTPHPPTAPLPGSSTNATSDPPMPGSVTPRAIPQEVSRSRPSNNRSSVLAQDNQSIASQSRSPKVSTPQPPTSPLPESRRTSKYAQPTPKPASATLPSSETPAAATPTNIEPPKSAEVQVKTKPPSSTKSRSKPASIAVSRHQTPKPPTPALPDVLSPVDIPGGFPFESFQPTAPPKTPKAPELAPVPEDPTPEPQPTATPIPPEPPVATSHKTPKAAASAVLTPKQPAADITAEPEQATTGTANSLGLVVPEVAGASSAPEEKPEPIATETPTAPNNAVLRTLEEATPAPSPKAAVKSTPSSPKQTQPPASIPPSPNVQAPSTPASPKTPAPVMVPNGSADAARPVPGAPKVPLVKSKAGTPKPVGTPAPLSPKISDKALLSSPKPPAKSVLGTPKPTPMSIVEPPVVEVPDAEPTAVEPTPAAPESLTVPAAPSDPKSAPASPKPPPAEVTNDTTVPEAAAGSPAKGLHLELPKLELGSLGADATATPATEAAGTPVVEKEEAEEEDKAETGGKFLSKAAKKKALKQKGKATPKTPLSPK